MQPEGRISENSYLDQWRYMFTLQMVGELLKNIEDEGGEYKPVDRNQEIGSLVLIDRGQPYMPYNTVMESKTQS